MSSSAVSVGVSSVAAAAVSSTAAVLAAGASVAVPSVNASVPSAVETFARSDVKSVSTLSVEPTVATATRSAALIFSPTYFWAESTARCTSSGCIELMSKTSAMSRRPASASDVIGAGAAGTPTFDGGVADRVASAAIFASTPPSNSADTTEGNGVSAISSKLALRTSCGRPSSRISKSAAVSPRTTAPALSRTMTSTEMTSRRARKSARS